MMIPRLRGALGSDRRRDSPIGQSAAGLEISLTWQVAVPAITRDPPGPAGPGVPGHPARRPDPGLRRSASDSDSARREDS
eukprot:754678-Hanusia_phi.AAC.3